jgi:hypothetical protein
MSVWWQREGLDVVDGRLRFAGRDAESIAREHGTPLHVYDPERPGANERVGRRSRGRAIGPRLNPRVGTGYSAQLTSGVACGFNAFNLPALYHFHQEVVSCPARELVIA